MKTEESYQNDPTENTISNIDPDREIQKEKEKRDTRLRHRQLLLWFYDIIRNDFSCNRPNWKLEQPTPKQKTPTLKPNEMNEKQTQKQW